MKQTLEKILMEAQLKAMCDDIFETEKYVDAILVAIQQEVRKCISEEKMDIGTPCNLEAFRQKENNTGFNDCLSDIKTKLKEKGLI